MNIYIYILICIPLSYIYLIIYNTHVRSTAVFFQTIIVHPARVYHTLIPKWEHITD